LRSRIKDTTDVVAEGVVMEILLFANKKI